MPVKEISREEFDAFGPMRSPGVALIIEETVWFAANGSLTGAVTRDRGDDDWGYVVLGPDEAGRFRAIALEHSMASEALAREALLAQMEDLLDAGEKMFPQDGPRGQSALFSVLVNDARLNPGFKTLLEEFGGAPARLAMQNVFDRLPKPDGNWVRDFQTAGFDARVWELYLFAWGDSAGYEVTRPADRPDYLFSDGERSVWIEAVTANPTPGQTEPPRPSLDDPGYLEAVRLRDHNFVPIKLGSPLFSKLNKRYWELPHVRGLPLVFAIEDFHHDSPFRDTSNHLTRYLYGQTEVILSGPGEPLKRRLEAVSDHRHGDKVIPSGFFMQPGAENVSAVLFSNSGTVPKFARMSYNAARHPFLRLIRYGTCVDFDPNAVVPKTFAYVVGDGTHEEHWAEGLEVFHNPRASIPLPSGFFRGAAEHYLREDGFDSRAPAFHPYSSVTVKFTEQNGQPFTDEESFQAMAAIFRQQLLADRGLTEAAVRAIMQPSGSSGVPGVDR